jgi:drug/metabolite transporter (DMT)-like permease
MTTATGHLAEMRPADRSPLYTPAAGAARDSLSPGQRRLRLRIGLSLLAVYVIWGSTYLAMRYALATMPPFLMGGIRFLLAGTILYIALRLRGAPRPSLREWRGAAIIGVLLLAGGNGFVAVGQQWVSSSVAAVVVATMPLWVALLSSVRGQRPSRFEWVGLLIGFAGVFVLHFGGELGQAPPSALILLLAPLCWAIGSVLSKGMPLPKGPMATAAEMLAGGTSMLVIGFAHGERLAVVPSLPSLLALGYLVVFGSIVAFSAYGFLLRETRPAVATSYAYVNPIIAVSLGALLGGERVGGMTWGATAIVLTGVVILTTARSHAAAAKP